MTRHWPEAGGSESRPYGCVQNYAVNRMSMVANWARVAPDWGFK